MTDAVETMAYAKSGGVPWHGMGQPVSDKMSVEDMTEAAKLNWSIGKKPIFFKKEDGTEIPVPGKFALIRETDESILSVVGSVYKPVQNVDAMSFFKKYVKHGHMTMETAGSLWHGKYIWALARVNKDFSIGKGTQADEVRSYLLLCSPHAIGRALVTQFTPTRVVCWNTLQMALGASLKGKGHAFRMPHSVEFTDAVKAKAEESLGIAIEQMAEFKEAATLLSKKKATDAQAYEYLCKIAKFDPKKKVDDKEEAKPPRLLNKFQHALTYAPGQQLNTAKGTWWGALNAVTHVIDHELGNDRQTALATAWFGQRSALKRGALELALETAGKAKAA